MPRIPKDFDVHDLIRRHEAGESLKQASKRLGYGRRALQLQMTKAGFTPRNRSEAMFVRMSRTSATERQRLSAAAHEAVRGKRQTDQHRIRVAKTKETTIVPTRTEGKMLAMLRSRGLGCIPQKAIGRYNVDVAVTEPPIAVEIFGGNWHSGGHHRRMFPKRADYILDLGWSLMIVWDQTRDPMSVHAADYIATFIKESRRDPSLRREYRVIRGCGEELARGRGHFNDLALVPSQRRTPQSRT